MVKRTIREANQGVNPDDWVEIEEELLGKHDVDPGLYYVRIESIQPL